MNKLAYILLCVCAYTSIQATKYICTQNNQSDSTFTTEFATLEEAREYCDGPFAVYESTGKGNYIDTLVVD